MKAHVSKTQGQVSSVFPNLLILTILGILLAGIILSIPSGASKPVDAQSVDTANMAAAVVASNTANANANASTRGQGTELASRVILQRNYGAWQLIATRNVNSSDISMSIVYSHSTTAALKQYAAANRLLANELSKMTDNVDVVITFSSLMPVDEYRTWVAAQGINVKNTTLRTLAGPNQGRASLGVPARGDDVLPQAMLERTEANIQGVYALRGTVDSRRLPALAGDPSVFLLDVTQTMAKRALLAEGISSEDIENASIRLRSPFWEMENQGLRHFKNQR